jgi:hypothetical protein
MRVNRSVRWKTLLGSEDNQKKFISMIEDNYPDAKIDFTQDTAGRYLDDYVEGLYLGWCLNEAKAWPSGVLI